MRARPWALTATGACAILAGVIAVGRAASPSPPFPFLRDAELVYSDRASYGLRTMPPVRRSVYNLRGELSAVSVRPICELLAKGWCDSDMGGARPGFRSLFKISLVDGLVRTENVQFLSGRAAYAAGSVGIAVDPIHTEDGWTAVIVEVNDNPSWWERLCDRVNRGGKRDAHSLPITLIPSSVYRRAQQPTSRMFDG